MEYWTAFFIGVLGSLHCIGMCGPIALSLPYQGQTKWQTRLNVVQYNIGRTFSYMLIGIVPGLLGLGVFISGYQTGLSFVIGFLLIGMALLSFQPERLLVNLPIYKKLSHYLQVQLSQQLKNKTQRTFLTIGMLNGFLPCGMVYMAVAGALTQSSVIGGMLYMLCFGLGTFPLMMLLTFSGQLISLRMRKKMYQAIPFFLFLFGLLFLWRGWTTTLPQDATYWLLSGVQEMCR